MTTSAQRKKMNKKKAAKRKSANADIAKQTKKKSANADIAKQTKKNMTGRTSKNRRLRKRQKKLEDEFRTHPNVKSIQFYIEQDIKYLMKIDTTLRRKKNIFLHYGTQTESGMDWVTIDNLTKKLQKIIEFDNICPICTEEDPTVVVTCSGCKNQFCGTCYLKLHEKGYGICECPFCRRTTGYRCKNKFELDQLLHNVAMQLKLR